LRLELLDTLLLYKLRNIDAYAKLVHISGVVSEASILVSGSSQVVDRTIEQSNTVLNVLTIKCAS
jgi:hypothetical protein